MVIPISGNSEVVPILYDFDSSIYIVLSRLYTSAFNSTSFQTTTSSANISSSSSSKGGRKYLTTQDLTTPHQLRAHEQWISEHLANVGRVPGTVAPTTRVTGSVTSSSRSTGSSNTPTKKQSGKYWVICYIILGSEMIGNLNIKTKMFDFEEGILIDWLTNTVREPANKDAYLKLQHICFYVRLSIISDPCIGSSGNCLGY